MRGSAPEGSRPAAIVWSRNGASRPVSRIHSSFRLLFFLHIYGHELSQYSDVNPQGIENNHGFAAWSYQFESYACQRKWRSENG